ncbi:MAG TPA: phosphoribosylglycinamide formyltransferase [Gemmatimonadaceae bacterium]|jgi:formyltetrahydrofolate-dependent phosphoribosylglycinamide formyltransferase|nr:phosphoribosylglycinamide formyltransferase [Gemmatimonadaceae bacterium]
MKARVAVLASGGGSNLQAILEYFDQRGERRGGDVVLVASDRPEAGALDRATRRKIPAAVHSSKKRPDGAPIDALLDESRIDLIVLAGYLRLVPPAVISRYEGRIVNVHPSLLPAFGGPGMYGQRVHHAVIDARVRVSGVTAHFVNDDYDRGCIIAQWPVPVFTSDDAGTLAARVLRVEHLLFPRVVDAVAAGRVTMAGCLASATDTLVDTRPSFTLMEHEDSRLAENVELALGWVERVDG